MALLSEDEVAERLADTPGWERRGGCLVRQWERADFADALAFVNRVGEAAEEANHHPDILIHAYKRVRLELSTHSAGGLTERDFAMAERISELA